MQQMGNTVDEMKDAMDEMKDNFDEILDDVGEVKDSLGEIKDGVSEIKCWCSPTPSFSVVETEASSQGTRSNRTFINGFPLQTRP